MEIERIGKCLRLGDAVVAVNKILSIEVGTNGVTWQLVVTEVRGAKMNCGSWHDEDQARKMLLEAVKAWNQ